jgi:hypothetical protein
MEKVDIPHERGALCVGVWQFEVFVNHHMHMDGNVERNLG